MFFLVFLIEVTSIMLRLLMLLLMVSMLLLMVLMLLLMVSMLLLMVSMLLLMVLMLLQLMTGTKNVECLFCRETVEDKNVYFVQISCLGKLMLQTNNFKRQNNALKLKKVNDT